MFSGNNMDGSTNFIPKMNYSELIGGYSKIIKTIYSQKEYYTRLVGFLKNYRTPTWTKNKIKLKEIRAIFMLVWLLGTLEKGKKYFWKLFFVSLWKYPRKFPTAMTLAVYGFHFRKVIRTV